LEIVQFIKEIDDAIGDEGEALRIPNARLGSEVPVAKQTVLLGSSQYTGCQGDFCSFDLSFLQSREVDSFQILDKSVQAVDVSGLSEFRKRLLYSGYGSDNFISKSSSLGKMISSPAGKLNGTAIYNHKYQRKWSRALCRTRRAKDRIE
jgi:hypothetical protein